MMRPDSARLVPRSRRYLQRRSRPPLAAQPGSVNVLIIGGGLSGLAAAVALKDQNRNITYAILERNAHLGGRTQTDPVEYFDFGGGYIGGAGSQNYINEAIQRFQIHTFKTSIPQDKDWLYQSGPLGRAVPFPDSDVLALPGNPDSAVWLGQLDAMSLEVRAYLADPWNYPKAQALDALNVQQFMEATLPRDTWDIFTASIRCAFSAEPRDLSALFFLWYAACAGSYSQLVDVVNPNVMAEGTRFTYGSRELVNAMADDAGPANIALGSRVNEVHLGADGRYVVTVADGDRTWSADRIIVALSPTQCRHIQFGDADNSLLSPERKYLQAHMPPGKTIKGFMKFKEPIWRRLGCNGCSGFLLSASPIEQFPAVWALDNCWEPTAAQRGAANPFPNSRSSLMTFIVGDSAEHWGHGSPEDRGNAIKKQLAAAFDMSETKFDRWLDRDEQGRFYTDLVWCEGNERGGCPTGLMGPGILSQYGPALRAPAGKIFWAGTESALEWAGYMNGAIAAGIRAALDASAGLP
jgi:monoamine oxidase